MLQIIFNWVYKSGMKEANGYRSIHRLKMLLANVRYCMLQPFYNMKWFDFSQFQKHR